jgi:NAD+ kinase
MVLKSVAVLFHPLRKRAVEESEWLGNELKRRGVEASIASAWDGKEVDQLCDARDVALVLGGDGTILHVARLAAPHGVPVVGINLGRIGFLAELTPEHLRERVDDLVEQRYWVEERAMLNVRYVSEGREFHDTCLNEVAVARGVAARAIQVRTTLDGDEFTTYTADGVLAATATGSTAYSLAAGGPILYPESHDFIITPVAPHLHIGRSTVVPQNTIVTLTLASDRPAVISVDGSVEHALQPGDPVEVSSSEQVALFARLNSRRYFYRAIADRLK